jgi:hypothetical protein
MLLSVDMPYTAAHAAESDNWIGELLRGTQRPDPRAVRPINRETTLAVIEAEDVRRYRHHANGKEW